MMKNPDIQDPRKTRKAAAQCPQRGSRFSPREKVREMRFEEEREDAFHRDRHSDDAACPAGEFRPSSFRTETPSDARNNAEQEVDSEIFAQKRAETSY